MPDLINLDLYVQSWPVVAAEEGAAALRGEDRELWLEELSNTLGIIRAAG